MWLKSQGPLTSWLMIPDMHWFSPSLLNSLSPQASTLPDWVSRKVPSQPHWTATMIKAFGTSTCKKKSWGKNPKYIIHIRKELSSSIIMLPSSLEVTLANTALQFYSMEGKAAVRMNRCSLSVYRGEDCRWAWEKRSFNLYLALSSDMEDPG